VSIVNVVEKGTLPEVVLNRGTVSPGRPKTCKVTCWSNSPKLLIDTMNTAGSSPRKTDLSYGDMEIEKSDEVSVVGVGVACGDGV